MKAYHGDTAIKDKYLARVREHREADQLVQGYGYWQDGKGCAVGCTIHGDDHRAYERELGIPRQIAWLEDRFFERLPVEEARAWPEKFLQAVPVGADLSLVFYRFLHWLLVDLQEGVLRHAKTEKTREAILDVGSLYERRIKGEVITMDEWLTVRDNARSARSVARAAAAAAAAAAADAADAAADADAADAAAAAAAADAAAADAAAADAAWNRYSETWDAAYKKSFIRKSEKLLELLATAPVEVAA